MRPGYVLVVETIVRQSLGDGANWLLIATVALTRRDVSD
jgi:hypothetical protein